MTTTLRAGAASLQVDPDDGGRWTSLRVDDLELLTGTTLPGGWPPSLYGCFPMAPYAGRLGRGELVWGGAVHRLPVTAPPHAIHGTVADVPWRVVDAGQAHVELQVPLAAPWPCRGTVTQRLVLGEDRLDAVLTVRAEDEMPVTVGQHPWFPRRLARGEPAELVVRGGRQYTRGEDGLPTGELVEPSPGPWDDCFVDLSADPVVRWPGALELTLRSSHRHWVVFDERPDVLCVEPQTGPPDAVRLGVADVVPAGGELALTVALEWRRL